MLPNRSISISIPALSRAIARSLTFSSLLPISHVFSSRRFVCSPFSSRSALSLPVRPFSSSARSVSVPEFTPSGPIIPGSSNPLLSSSFSVPPFSSLTPSVLESAITTLLPILDNKLTQLEQRFANSNASVAPSYSELVDPYADLLDRLEFAVGCLHHLKSVCDSPELRSVVERLDPTLVNFESRREQSKILYNQFSALQRSSNFSSLSPAQRRIVDLLVQRAQLGGVAIEKTEDKKEFNRIQERLSALSTRFQNNVLDSTKSFGMLLTKEEEMAGLSAAYRDLTAQSARKRGQQFAQSEELKKQCEKATDASGPWLITLDSPSVVPFLELSERRDLREKLYKAYVSIASSEADNPQYDNAEIIGEILTLRQRAAQLLGFSCFSDYVLASKTLKKVELVDSFLESIREPSLNAAKRELEELKEFVRSQSGGAVQELRLWDVPYWAEKLKAAKFQFNEDELRPYFQFPQVLNGLFQLVQRLFGVEIRNATGSVPTWHPDVSYYTLHDSNGQRFAAFFVDPYMRPGEKLSGAWMNDLVNRSRIHMPDGSSSVRQPIGYMVCNQAPPVGDQPALMSFRDVTTLFHEWGHLSQLLLSQVDESRVSGLRGIEWDSVEIASQFLENFCYHKATLKSLTKHVKTGEPISDDMFERILAAKNYRAASMSLRQCQFSMVDMAIHSKLKIAADEKPSEVARRVFELERSMMPKLSLLEPLPNQRFLCAFLHIFANSYASGYWSYKFAECMSEDAFSVFEEVGLDDEKKIRELGDKYRRTILGLGGSEPAAEIYRKFRGRDATVEPMLRRAGILK